MKVTWFYWTGTFFGRSCGLSQLWVQSLLSRAFIKISKNLWIVHPVFRVLHFQSPLQFFNHHATEPLFPHSMTGHHPSRVWILDADVPTTPPNYSSQTLRRTYTPGPVGQVYLSGIYFRTLPCKPAGSGGNVPFHLFFSLTCFCWYFRHLYYLFFSLFLYLRVVYFFLLWLLKQHCHFWLAMPMPTWLSRMFSTSDATLTTS